MVIIIKLISSSTIWVSCFGEVCDVESDNIEHLFFNCCYKDQMGTKENYEKLAYLVCITSREEPEDYNKLWCSIIQQVHIRGKEEDDILEF